MKNEQHTLIEALHIELESLEDKLATAHLCDSIDNSIFIIRFEDKRKEILQAIELLEMVIGIDFSNPVALETQMSVYCD